MRGHQFEIAVEHVHARVVEVGGVEEVAPVRRRDGEALVDRTDIRAIDGDK